MAEKCNKCGNYLAWCSECLSIFCPKCNGENCPGCQRHINAGNVIEVCHKIAKIDLSK